MVRRMVEGLTFNVIKKQDISENMYAEILDLCTRAYGMDFQPLLETFSDATYILGRYGGQLVTHALWVTRWIQYPGFPPWRTAYVEAVATDERYRNRGFASLVMKKIAREIKDFDVGGLSTGLYGFYSRLGWMLWRGPLSVRKNDELIPTPGDTVMVLLLPKTPKIDINKQLSIEWRDGELW